jgi:hypothetical protein
MAAQGVELNYLSCVRLVHLLFPSLVAAGFFSSIMVSAEILSPVTVKYQSSSKGSLD